MTRYDFRYCENCISFRPRGDAGFCAAELPKAGVTVWPQVDRRESCGGFVLNADLLFDELDRMDRRLTEAVSAKDQCETDISHLMDSLDEVRADLAKERNRGEQLTGQTGGKRVSLPTVAEQPTSQGA